jgi:peptide-methionine (S)-S-oxide reductase
MDEYIIDKHMSKLEVATFALGCFWCGEALYKMLKGVDKVTSGYSGGQSPNPTYEDLHYNNTGHAEAIQVLFDPAIISYKDLLDVFWKLHDPTTLNQPGTADDGPEYRSIIFYHTDEQKKLAEETKKVVEESKIYENPVITEIVPYKKFYQAEEEHQDFYKRYPNMGYCRVVIDPKIEKLKKNFGSKLKEE